MGSGMADANKKYRFERKYLLNEDSAFLLRQRISYLLAPDQAGREGKYHISSLYFDDQYNSAFYEKLNGVSRRDKFRVRFYNGSKDIIRLERKQKHGEMICKESTFLSGEQYEMMQGGDYDFMKTLQNAVVRNFYATHIMRHMHPVIMVDYERQAYVHQAGNVRITFDTGLMASLPMSGRQLLAMPEQSVILEIKYDHFLPAFISAFLTGIPVSQQLAISKYVMARLSVQGIYGSKCRIS